MDPMSQCTCPKCNQTFRLGESIPCSAQFDGNVEAITANCGAIGQPWVAPAPVPETEDDMMRRVSKEAWAEKVKHLPVEDAFEVPAGSPWGSFDKLNRPEPCRGLMKPKTTEATQVGGDHYLNLAIQPMRYSMMNRLDAAQHTAIKYITRFRDKGGIQDLEKAKHCIDLLIEFEREFGRA